MFTYAYSLADGKVKIEDFDALDDALERARLHYRTLRNEGWHFGAIRDAREVVLYDEPRFREFIRSGGRPSAAR